MRFPRSCSLAVLALASALVPAGCVNETTSTQKDTTPSFGGHVQRGKERQVASNDLRQIALYYQSCRTEKGRAPDGKQLEDYIKRDPDGRRIAKGIEEGRYVLAPNPGTGSDAVLAYEKDKDLNGNRLVVRVAGAPTLMNEQEFQAALKGG